ncbi:uncharacterized protein LOC107767445 [Nicotiana tabacum]|uniref:Uncharacterized protein LOC107767445 n=1 Tax=Nicotiana tabacum TaxID=4097 RepID=A0AC58SIF8_TOBAC
MDSLTSKKETVQMQLESVETQLQAAKEKASVQVEKIKELQSQLGLAISDKVPYAVLRKDIVYLLDFIDMLTNGRVHIALDMDEIEKLTLELTFMSSCLQLCYFILDGFDAEMSCISYEVHDLVQSLFHKSGDDLLVKLKDHVVPRFLETIKSSISSDHHFESSVTMTDDQLVELLDSLLVNLHYLRKYRAELIFQSITQYELLQNVCGNLRDFHRLKVNGCTERETIEYVLPQFQLMAERVGHFCFVLLADQIDVPQVNSMLAHLLLKIIPVELEVMHICSTNLKDSKSAQVGRFIKQLLEPSPDILREYVMHLQAHMITVITASTSARNIHVMIEFLLIILTDVSKDVIHYDKLFVLLAHVVALTREVGILVRNLEENSRNEENMNETSCASLDLLKNIELLKEDLRRVFLKAPILSSQFCFPMIALIKKEIGLIKEDLEFIRSFFGNVEQELDRDLWTCVLDVAYEAEHAINSILIRDHGLLNLIFLLLATVKKIKHLKEEVPQKISKKRGLIIVNSPNKLVESKSSKKLTGKIIVGFEEETNLIIRQLTSGPAELDVISIIGMPGAGKTTLAYKMRNLEDFDVDDELRKKLYGRRYLIVLDDLWDTAAWDELTFPFQDLQKRSRIILTSRKKEVALHGKRHTDPLNLRLLRPEESWELLEKKVFGEESCPDELRYVGEEIARKCEGLPLVLDLIGGVIATKENEQALWLEVLHNLKSFKNEEEVMKVIQLSYDHLSDHLKRCLLYFASYPKDQDIEISELKSL